MGLRQERGQPEDHSRSPEGHGQGPDAASGSAGLNAEGSGARDASERSLENDRTKGVHMDRQGLESARRVVAALLLAKKNCSFYPEGHSACTASIEQFHSMLSRHIMAHGPLMLEVERDRLVSGGETAHDDDTGEQSLPFILFRDGIRWIEFQDGVDIQEVKEFIGILNKYGILALEPEGDIVTELWERRFEHIRHEATNKLPAHGEDAALEEDPGKSRDPEGMRGGGVEWGSLGDVTDPSIGIESLVLTPEERMTLEEMVRMEEDGDPAACLDALFDSLLLCGDQEHFMIILDVLKEDFSASMARSDLPAASKILNRLQYVKDELGRELPPVKSLVEDFLEDISTPDKMAPLVDLWEEITDGQAQNAMVIFKMLAPRIVSVLCSLLRLNQSPVKRRLVEEAVAQSAQVEPESLERVLKDADEKLLERLVPVLAVLEGERPLKHLLRLVRHPSPHVRIEALRHVFRKGAHIREVFPLIDDRDETLRRTIVKHLGMSRNQTAERLLLEYLQHHSFGRDEQGHMVACFTALGQCGSSRSLAFLKRTLLFRPWMPAFWRKSQRLGAAIALNRLGLKESAEILARASRSPFLPLRGIVKEAGKARAKDMGA